MKFEKPSKKIFDGSDLPNFRRSIAYANIQDSIKRIVFSVKSYDLPKGVVNLELVSRKPEGSTRLPPTTTLSQDKTTEESKNLSVIIEMLQKYTDLVKEVPPLEGPRRFGNLAFKEWFKKLEACLNEDLNKLEIKSNDKEGFLVELSYYIHGAFGSNVRLDYGTGHELSFVAFIGALLRYNIFEGITAQQLLCVFVKYYDLVRTLILTYTLEPAGSHGVWGLDDHFHFIYILGAAQFNEPVSKYAPPVKECLNDSIISDFKGSNLYINAIAFIKKIKSGPFNEHSPIIYDIHHSVSLWKKVLSGLLKMYDVEVLGKFPVVQHFWFGNVLYPWKDENHHELPYNPITQQESSNKVDNDGFINGVGVNTTKSNISMTAVPWKTNASTRSPFTPPSMVPETTRNPGRSPTPTGTTPLPLKNIKKRF